jgi:hypothetical protein
VTGLLELTGEVAGKLGGPRARGCAVISGRCTRRIPVFMDERGIQALERDHAAGVEQVRSQQRRGGGTQESTPGLIAVHRWRDAMSAQDLADGGGVLGRGGSCQQREPRHHGHQ